MVAVGPRLHSDGAAGLYHVQGRHRLKPFHVVGFASVVALRPNSEGARVHSIVSKTHR